MKPIRIRLSSTCIIRCKKMWAITAIGAAIIWGFSYAVSERLLKAGFTPSFMMATYAVIAMPIYSFVAYKNQALGSQIALMKNNPKWALVMLGIVLLYTAANYLIFSAIQQKNATVVSLIEIAYPLFTAFFAWLLFKDMQLNWGVGLGAILILSGMACVILFAK